MKFDFLDEKFKLYVKVPVSVCLFELHLKYRENVGLQPFRRYDRISPTALPFPALVKKSLFEESTSFTVYKYTADSI